MKKKKENKLVEKKVDKSMPLLSHLKELRIRLLRCLVVTFLVFLACYFYRSELLSLLKKPVEEPLAKYSQLKKDLEPSEILKQTPEVFNCRCLAPESQQKNDIAQEGRELNLNCSCQTQPTLINPAPKKSHLVFISLPEVFFSELKVSLFLAFFFSFPYWLAEIWAFVVPGLYKNEKKVFLLFVPATFIFFIGGAVFGYFVVFPIGFDFFISLARPEEIIPSLSVGQYVSFAIKLLFAFGLIFEFPLVVLFLSRMGLLSPMFMLRNLKYAVVFIFISSAVLTPPDPFTMFLMAAPLSLLYCFSIIICYLVYNRKKAELRKQGLAE